MFPPLLVFEAKLKLTGYQTERVIPVEEFVTSPGCNLLKSEILTEVSMPLPEKSGKSTFIKIGRSSEDLATVSGAAFVSIKSDRFICVRIALGAVAPRPIRAKHVEQALVGQMINATTINKAALEVIKDISPITDLRSSAEFRFKVSQVIIKRLIRQLTT